jgi:hypothetical protein
LLSARRSHLFVAALVVVESRAGGSTLRRGLAYGAITAGIAVAVATVKWFIK